jgi:DNA (cytosine-5)-methyltransferase 1
MGNKTKVLNLYAGIGGNRKLWKNVDVTAVELNPEIAAIYQGFFPNDTVIVGDALQYLLKHFKEFDFIWSSPPCPSHSVTNHFLKGQNIYRLPDMTLYQQIIFLKTFFEGKWIIENVIPYYEPLIKQTAKMGRHLFWANFRIKPVKIDYVDIGTMNRKASKEAQRKAIIREAQIPELIDLHGLKDFKLKNKRQVLRNCVLPEIGLNIFNDAMDIITQPKYEQPNLF